jgi:hypothetical protein
MADQDSFTGIQPVAGSLQAVVMRACRQPDCPKYGTIDCPEHSNREDLGIVASFDHRDKDAARV